MEKEFVPYELAVKLKALGFDKKCGACYYKKFDNEIGYHKVYRDFNFVQLTVSAPTFSQAFRWFREKYSIWCEITSQLELKYHSAQILPKGNWFCKNVNTYEEAELACLDKLIEIVESKSE